MAVGLSNPMGARMRRKMLRYGDGGVAFQMLQQSSRYFVGQREFQRGRCLTLMDAENSLSPRNVIQRECNDLAGAQTISGDQDKYRVVAQTNRGGDVDRSQKLDHSRPR